MKERMPRRRFIRNILDLATIALTVPSTIAVIDFAKTTDEINAGLPLPEDCDKRRCVDEALQNEGKLVREVISRPNTRRDMAMILAGAAVAAAGLVAEQEDKKGK